MTAQIESNPSEQVVRRHRIAVWASDPITEAGLISMLPLVGFHAVSGADPAQADVLLVSVDSDPGDAPRVLAAAAEAEGVPVVWMHRGSVTEPLQAGTLRPSGKGAPVAVLHAGEASVDEIGRALLQAVLPCIEPQSDEVVTELPLSTASSDETFETGAPELTPIERDVLRLLADGRDTSEIAGSLFYSERTVKNVIARAVHHLGAVNRSQAVATAIRRGYL